MKKKLLLGLLVVLMVGILAFSVFACQPKDPKPDADDNKKPVDPPQTEETVDVKAGPMFDSLINSINNTIKVVNKIESEASVNADLYVDVKAGDATYNVKLNISGSVNSGAYAENWALVSADVLGVQVGLFAERAADNKEYLYVGQNILNEDVVWSKLDQAENAQLLEGKAVPALLNLVAGLDEAKFFAGEEFTDSTSGEKKNEKWDEGEAYVDSNGNGKYDGPSMFGGGEDVTDVIEAGLLNKISILNTVKSVVNIVGGLLFAPIDGVNTIEDGTTDLSTADGYAARLNIEELSGVISGVMPFLKDMLTGVNLADYQGIVDMVVPMLLGGNLNLTDMTFTPIPNAIPDIRLLVDINDDDTFGGLHLSYETADKATKVAFGLDNISFKAEGAAKPAAIVDAVEDAEELAINLGLDLQLGAIEEGGYANLDLNVYPNVSVGFDEDGYLALDLSNLYAEVIMTADGYDWETGDNVPTQYVVAQYNLDGNEDIIINLTQVANKLGYASIDGNVYKVPVNLSEKFAAFIQSEKDKANATEDEDALVENAGLVDTVIGAVGSIMAPGADVLSIVIDLAGQIGTIVDEVTALAEFVTVEEGTATVDVEALILALIADDGLIGESEKAVFGLYNAEGVKEDVALADIMAKDAVLGNIAALVNALMYEGAVAEEDRETTTYAMWKETADLVTVEEIIGLVNDFTGATLDANNAYANMEISATGFAQGNGANGEGIGAIVSAVLGKDDNTAEIKLGLNASLIENTTEYGNADTDIFYYENNFYAIENGEVIAVSNNTGKDGGKLLLNDVKKIFNTITTVEGYDIHTFETIETISVDSEATGTDIDPISIYESGTYAVESYFGVCYVVDAIAGSKVTISNVCGADAVDVITSGIHPMTGMPMDMRETKLFADGDVEITVADANGAKFVVYGPAEGIALVDIQIEVAGQSWEAPAIGTGTYELPMTPGSSRGTGYYFIAVEMEAAGTITLTTTGTNVSAAGIASAYDQMNWMNPVTWVGSPVIGQVGAIDPDTNVPAYVAEGSIEITEAGTYVIAVAYGFAGDITVAVAQNG